MPRGIHISGNHTAPDGSIEFEYEGTWRRDDAGLIWNATVRFKGKSATYLAGAMSFGADAAADDALIRAGIVRMATDAFRRAH